MKRELPLVLLVGISLVLSASAFARGGGGGGGFHEGGGFRDDDIQRDGDNVTFDGADGKSGNVDVDREGDGNANVDFGYGGKTGSAQINRDNGDTSVDATGLNGRSVDANVDRVGDGVSTVNVQTGSGRTYDAAVVGPQGIRDGYIWRDNAYVPVNLEPMVPYAAPYGDFVGWSIVTLPAYIEYPVYATYPIETAVEVQLAAAGYYTGAIDGIADSASAAISAYQEASGLEVTGKINPALLNALGIQASPDGD